MGTLLALWVNILGEHQVAEKPSVHAELVEAWKLVLSEVIEFYGIQSQSC